MVYCPCDSLVLGRTRHLQRILRGEVEHRGLAEKALVLWLNSTWGILSLLVNRQETEGPWTRLKVGQWRLLPVLDVASLDAGTLRKAFRGL